MGKYRYIGKYNVGDKVRLRSDLVVGNKYANNVGEVRTHFAQGMAYLVGKEVTINKVSQFGYQVDEGSTYWFTDGMIEHVPLLERKVLPIERFTKMELYVEKVIVQDPATIMFYKVASYNPNTGAFEDWSDTKKIVAKCNKDDGDKYDIGKGVEVAMLKAYRREIDKLLRKF
jgi:hypothetical protein